MATVVTLAGSVLLPSGAGPRSGTITAELDGNAKDSSGNKIVGRVVIPIPDGGLLTGAGATIVATADLTPATRQYIVRISMVDDAGNAHAREERWEVAASSPQNVGDLAV
jgi:hypothetical protein